MEKEKEEKEEEEKNTTAPSEDKKTATTATTATTKTTATTATTATKAPMKLDKVKKNVLQKRSDEALERKKMKFMKKKMKKKEDMNQNKPKEGEEEEGEGAAAAEEEEEHQPDVEKLKDLKKKKKNRDLKSILADNGFAASGDFNTLLQKYSEGSKHGGLPKCPNCKRSGLSVKLDESMKNGEVRCPGHFDKETNTFQKCSFESTLAKIERPAWEEEEEEEEEEKEEEKEKEKEEETRRKTTEEKQPLEASLSEDEWKEFQVLETKFNRQHIKSEDLKDAICSMIKSKGLVVGGDKTDVGFFIAQVLHKNTKRSSLSLRPALDEILKKYPKAGTDKVANEENNAIFKFLSKLEARAKVAAAKEKEEEEEENVPPTLDAKTGAIVKKGLTVMRKFPHPVNTEAMVDAMMKGGVVNKVDVKKISGFGDSVANLFKFLIKNQAEEESALIEMALGEIQEYAQKKKEQAAATTKKQTTEKPKKKQATTMKRKEKPTKSPTKESPDEKKAKVSKSQRNANED